jgi:hypothetical protein
MKLELTQDQAKHVAFNHIADTMITMKQYKDNSVLRKYKFMLYEFGTLYDVDAVGVRYDKEWPTALKWDDL